MTDQIDLHKPGPGVVPLSPRAHRDRALQQRAGLGMRPPTWIEFGPVRLEPAVDRGRRDLQQQARRRIIDLELAEPPQPGHQVRHRRRQQPAARCSLHRPQEPQRPHHRLVIERRPRRPRLDRFKDQCMRTAPREHDCDANRSARTPGPRPGPCQPWTPSDYSSANFFVTALRSLIVSSIDSRLPPPANRPPQTHRCTRTIK